MQNKIIFMGSTLLMAMLGGNAAAALQGRDLDGNRGTFEAYYDTESNLTWLADANYAKTSGRHETGLMNWHEANAWAAGLSFTDGVRVYDNWRLPAVNPVNGVSFNYNQSLNGSTDRAYNVSAPGSVFAGGKGSEIAYLFYNTLGNKSLCKPETSTFGCDGPQPGWGELKSGPFSNMSANLYWTGTAYAPRPGEAWNIDFNFGAQSSNLMGAGMYAWAVTQGDVAAVPEADTWAMLLAGLGLLGLAARRRAGRG